MKTEEIDQIIAEALEKDIKRKKRNKKKDWKKKNSNKVEKIRKTLNILFIIGFVAALLIYFIFPEQRTLFFSIGFGAMFLKIAEYFLRFLF